MTPFIIEGDLWLRMQEGGFAWDGWSLGSKRLDDIVALHFKAQPQWETHWRASRNHIGDRHIGSVRITIERLEED